MLNNKQYMLHSVEGLTVLELRWQHCHGDGSSCLGRNPALCTSYVGWIIQGTMENGTIAIWPYGFLAFQLELWLDLVL